MSLAQQHCTHIATGTPPMAEAEIQPLLVALPGWSVREGRLHKQFSFPSYGQTIAFVNAVAWIAEHQDHHPDMMVGYKCCEVAFSTHTVGGISMNDFICAARVEALL